MNKGKTTIKYKLLIAVLFLFIYISVVPITATAEEEPIDVQALLDVYGEDITLSLYKSESRQYEVALRNKDTYTIYDGDELCGYLIFETYLLDNNDLYYLIRVEGEKHVASTLSFSLSLPVKREYTYSYFSYPLGRNNISSILNGPINSSEQALNVVNTAYIDGKEFSLITSCINAYEEKENEVLKDIPELSKYITVSSNEIKGELFIEEGYVVELWGIYSTNQLVDLTDEWQVKIAKNADFSSYRKWSMNGQYYITPISYAPYGEDYFYHNVAHHVGEMFLQTDGLYFQDMAKVALYTASNNQQQSGVWYTSPSSNWLYEDYAIGHYFYDTRFNTDAALFLLRGYREYGDIALLNGARKYGEFLVNYAKTHHYATKNDGFLVYDYSSTFLEELPTHVSLNHVITEMNFLYELYIDCDNISYYLTGDKIKQAIKDTYMKWPKDNNDLWYAYMPDGTYNMADYVNLTLRDLQYSQQLMTFIHGNRDHAFDYLIDKKTKYLIKHNLPLTKW